MMVGYMTGAPQKGQDPGPATAPAPPPGTYDPGIDYNAGASERGYQNTFDDAATLFERGREDYNLGVGDLDRSRGRSLADLLTGQFREQQDYETGIAENQRQFGILGRQQNERAAQQGIQSQGILGQAARVRMDNQNREHGRIDQQHLRNIDDTNTARTRVGEDYSTARQRLDLGFGREFGGFRGNQFNSPLTGQPMVGSLLTQLTRAGTENNAFQTYSAGQRASQAAQNGYVSPSLMPASPSADAAREFQRRLRGGR